MSRTSVWTQVGVAVLIICLTSFDLSRAAAGHKHVGRQKRGFRNGAASRVAHGYGKRAGDLLSLASSGALPSRSDQVGLEDLVEEPYLPKVGMSNLAGLMRLGYEDEGMLASVEEFAQLLTKHRGLARAIVKKFVDLDRDGFISTDELFRSTRRE